MKKKTLRRLTALVMALFLAIGAILPAGSYVYATDIDTGQEMTDAADQENGSEALVLYNAADRTDLEPEEVAAAEDIIVAAGYGFDVEQSVDGISYTADKVKVSYYPDMSFFDGTKPGEYSTYYKVEPVSGRKAYLICRTISVIEPETAASEAAEEQVQDDKEKAASGQKSELSRAALSKGEMENFQAGDNMVIQMASLPVLMAAASNNETMKVSCSGYSQYCGHSIGIK